MTRLLCSLVLWIPTAALAVQPPEGAPSGAEPVRIRHVDAARQAALSARPVWHDFLASEGAGWEARWDEATGTPHRMWGPGLDLGPIASDAALTAASLDFAARHPELLGLTRGEVVVRALGRDPIRNRAYVDLDVLIDGAPVWRHGVRLRFVHDRLVMVGAETYPSAPTRGRHAPVAGRRRRGLPAPAPRRARRAHPAPGPARLAPRAHRPQGHPARRPRGPHPHRGAPRALGRLRRRRHRAADHQLQRHPLRPGHRRGRGRWPGPASPTAPCRSPSPPSKTPRRSPSAARPSTAATPSTATPTCGSTCATPRTSTCATRRAPPVWPCRRATCSSPRTTSTGAAPPSPPSTPSTPCRASPASSTPTSLGPPPRPAPR